MALPADFLKAAPVLTTSNGTGSAATPTRPCALAYPVVFRQEPNWCWAAVAKATADFYSAPGPSQCAIATTALATHPNPAVRGLDCCIAANASGPCNVEWKLDVALSVNGNFAPPTQSVSNFPPTVPPFASALLSAEMAAQRPVGVRIKWADTGSHFVAVYGYDVDASGTEYVCVGDPDPIYAATLARSRDRILLWDLATRYDVTGEWTTLYPTTP